MKAPGRPAQYGTAEAQAELVRNAGKTHRPPPGFKLANRLERNVWNMLMRTRAYKDWTPSDLIVAYRVVKIETLIRRGSETLERMIEQGADPFDPESVANDYNRQLMMAQKTQIGMLRALGFTRGTLPSQKTDQRRGQEEREMEDDIMAIGRGLPAFMASA